MEFERTRIIPLYDRRHLVVGPSDQIFLLSHNEHLHQIKDGVEQDPPLMLGTLNTDERVEIFGYLRDLERKLLPRIAESISVSTSVSFDERGWQIFLGHWLRRLIESAYLRYSLFTYFEFGLDDTVVEFSGTRSWVPERLSDWYQSHFEFEGEFGFNSRCLQLMMELRFGQPPRVEKIGCRPTDHQLMMRAPGQKKVWRTIAKLDRTFAHLTRADDVMITASYLPKRISLGIQLRLGQIPRVFRSHLTASPEGPLATVSWAVRDQLAASIKRKDDDEFTELVCGLVKSELPISYLEGLPSLTRSVEGLPWPKRPRAIFTSNLFDSSEEFKVYVASKILAGSYYLVGQHGNSYGVRVGQNPTIEEETSDLFLSWGWTLDRPKVYPLGNLKSAGVRNPKSNPSGPMLWVLNGPTAHLEPFSSWHLDRLTQQNTDRLLSLLRGDLLEASLFRRHPVQRLFDIERAASEFGTQESTRSFLKDARKSRIVVFNYDSTGFLELIGSDVPCLLFAADTFPHVGMQWGWLYSEMERVGLLASTPEACASLLHKIWPNPRSWWNSESVREVRSLILRNLAVPIPSPIRQMSQLLSLEHLR